MTNTFKTGDNLERFIRYMYEYEQGKRIRNVGFVKVEAGNEETIVHMQGKGFHKSDDRRLALYLFYEENGETVSIYRGETELSTPMMSHHLRFAADEEELRTVYPEIRGVVIKTEGKRTFAVAWDDCIVDVDAMRPHEEITTQPATMKQPQNADQSATTTQPVTTHQPQHPDQSSDQPSEPTPPRKTHTKISRSDLAKLPRCEWKHANNRFLLHGYNNYHHLLLIEDGDYTKLGIPGIYHVKEARVAEKFGFSDFISVEELDITLNEEEMHQDEPFGYWCRPVRTGTHQRMPQ